MLSDRLTSIYFGGGTPSLCPDIVEAVITELSPGPECEVTLEYNPERIEAVPGVTRASIGVQSLDDALLKRLGRTHTADEARRGVEMAASFARDVTIDLMYDVPGQRLDVWQSTVKEATTLPITHLSLYNLTIEPHTPFWKENMGRFAPPEEVSLEMLEFACEAFERTGLKRYEISAFARNGRYAVHNSGYWKGTPFVGIGPSAFSYVDGVRSQNQPNFGRYLRAAHSGEGLVSFSECLPPSKRIGELLAIRLRLLEGVDIASFEREVAPLPEVLRDALTNLAADGLVELDGGRVSLSKRGLLFYDSVAGELVEP
jgi:oxygen-independent coproporphyrinogen-3 oxidase